MLLDFCSQKQCLVGTAARHPLHNLIETRETRDAWLLPSPPLPHTPCPLPLATRKRINSEEKTSAKDPYFMTVLYPLAAATWSAVAPERGCIESLPGAPDLQALASLSISRSSSLLAWSQSIPVTSHLFVLKCACQCGKFVYPPTAAYARCAIIF
jgi:hypothetical protein